MKSNDDYIWDDAYLYANERTIAQELRSFNSSLNRSKNNIFELVHCNKWDWFVTLTFSNDIDRTDYDLLLKKLTKWIDNMKQRYASNLKYIIVPEQHKRIEDNGKRAYHFHGLFSDCGNMIFEKSHHKKSHNPIYSKNGLRVYNMPQYSLGFCSATKVQDSERCSNYMTKYITKALCIRQKGKRRFLSSRNLEKPQVELYYLDEHNFADFIPIDKITYHKSVQVNVGNYNNQIDYYIINTTNSQNN